MSPRRSSSKSTTKVPDERRLRAATRATAYHEAAHLVAGHLLTPRAGQLELSIERRGDTLGRVIAGGIQDGDGVREVEGMIVFLFAGYAAEMRLDPDAEQSARIGANDDFDAADEHVKYLTRGVVARNHRRDALLKRTHRFVRDHWKEITAVAELVLEVKRLTGNGTIPADLGALAVEASKGDRNSKSSLAAGLAMQFPELSGARFNLRF